MNDRPRPEQTADGWDRVAEGYATYIDPAMAPYVEEALDLVPVGRDDRVLDVACGSGALTLEAARRGAEVLGADFSREQIRLLRDRIDEEGIDGCQARVMDGQDLDLEETAFDTAFSMFGLMIFPDRARGFAELHRVLEPDGRALVTAWNEPSTNEWFALFLASLERALPDAPDPDPPDFMELADADRFRDEMAEAGFEGVEVHTIDRAAVFPDVDTTWRALTQGNPALPGMMEELGSDAVEKIHDAFEAICAERYGDGPVELSAEAHFAVGNRS